MRLSSESEKALIAVADDKGIHLEGNLLKVLETDSPSFSSYVEISKKKDRQTREKRLEVTKKFQKQNAELAKKAEENFSLMGELKDALDAAENAKKEVERDLDILQKKSQFELIGSIVNVALYVIIGVGVSTTVLYCYALYYNVDTTLIGNAWSNMFGILLTNSFSIIGTIMGVKYASNESAKK